MRFKKVAALFLVLVPLATVAWSVFSKAGLVGVQDWDMFYFLRYLVPHSILKYGEMPWWHPWYLGGYTAWGLGEGDSNFISPFLPFYLLLPFDLAVRSEVLGYAVIGAVGMWFLSGRFIKDHWLRALAVSVGFLNGRWTIQMAVGHFWHLDYAWLVWGIYFYDRALEEGRYLWAALAGACASLLVYGGGIYPAPHFMLFLILLTVLTVRRTKSKQAIELLLYSGVVGIGIAAPKLFAVADAMTRNPRHTGSPEFIDPLRLIFMMVWPGQRLSDHPVPVPDYGWWEYGIFIGWIGFAVVAVGCWRKGLLRKDGRLARYQDAGLAFLLLGFGTIPLLSPWFWLHALPVFHSLHVPSRFHFVAVLLLTLVGLAFIERSKQAKRYERYWGLICAIGVLNIAWVELQTWKDVFTLKLPERIVAAPLIRHQQAEAVQYEKQAPGDFYRYPSLLANVDVLDNRNITDFSYKKAIPQSSPDYRGEVFLSGENGEKIPGQVELKNWTPNSALATVTGAPDGALLVLNTNTDWSWSANGVRCLKWHDMVATRLVSGASTTVEFRYRPRTLPAAFTVLVLSLLGALLWPGRFGVYLKRRLGYTSAKWKSRNAGARPRSI